MTTSLPLIAPRRLSLAREPFDGPDWIFELKHDEGACRLVSRNGNEFNGFEPLCEEIARNLQVKNAILDGEICCLGTDGRSLFNELLFRRGVPHFYAFGLLWLNGRDLRQWPLLRRKAKLCSILPGESGPILFATHVDTTSTELFGAACEHDLEGIVAKRKDSPYECGERVVSWLKIRNPGYSQITGRHELFDRRHRPSVRSTPTAPPAPPIFNIQTEAFELE